MIINIVIIQCYDKMYYIFKINTQNKPYETNKYTQTIFFPLNKNHPVIYIIYFCVTVIDIYKVKINR